MISEFIFFAPIVKTLISRFTLSTVPILGQCIFLRGGIHKWSLRRICNTRTGLGTPTSLPPTSSRCYQVPTYPLPMFEWSSTHHCLYLPCWSVSAGYISDGHHPLNPASPPTRSSLFYFVCSVVLCPFCSVISHSLHEYTGPRSKVHTCGHGGLGSCLGDTLTARYHLGSSIPRLRLAVSSLRRPVTSVSRIGSVRAPSHYDWFDTL